MSIFRARLETSSFSFETYGSSAKEARSLMRKAWVIHQRQTGATAKFDDYVDGIWTLEVKLGGLYRDNELLNP